MKQNYISLDFFNQNYSARIDGIEHVFSSEEAFYNLTKFPYKNNLVAVSVEPFKNIYTVMYTDGTQHHDEYSDEVKWLLNHLPELKNAMKNDVTVDNFEPTVRDYRNAYLNSTDWLIQRHQEEKLLDVETTLTDEKFRELLEYREALRHIPESYSSLDQVVWPTNPLNP